jgi:hypothetical protein
MKYLNLAHSEFSLLFIANSRRFAGARRVFALSSRNTTGTTDSRMSALQEFQLKSSTFSKK